MYTEEMDFAQYGDIIFFALIAIFFVMRLRSVLGKEDHSPIMFLHRKKPSVLKQLNLP